MPRGEKLFRFLAGLMLQRFYGTVTIRFETGKVTHVTAETTRTWDTGIFVESCCRRAAEPVTISDGPRPAAFLVPLRTAPWHL
jgi:hypothetical protein